MRQVSISLFWVSLCSAAAGPPNQGVPVLSAWILSADAGLGAAETVRRILPDVHQVSYSGHYVFIESAGLSLASFGPLETDPYGGPEGVRQFLFRIPLQPQPAAAAHASTPLGETGVFVNGVPIYNSIARTSYLDQNLWHRDAVANSKPAPGSSTLLSTLLRTTGGHSPIIGYAFDGYPIYGPYGFANPEFAGPVRGMKSGYRLRRLSRRITYADGTELTPGQYGPDVSAAYPLGVFIEDYEFAAAGDLDEHNGRFCVTPDYPEGTYAYFLATDDLGKIAYPYLIGPTYHGEIAPAELRVASHARKPAAAGPLQMESKWVVNAASLEPAFAPASLATARGLNFSASTGSAPPKAPVSKLEGLTVTLTDSRGAAHLCPLSLVSPEKINFEIASEAAEGTGQLRFTRDDGSATTVPIVISPVAPGLFSADFSGQGAAAGYVQRSSGGSEAATAPIDLSAGDGAVSLVLFGTGFRKRSSVKGVRVSIAGEQLDAIAAGPQGAYSGLDQLVVNLPRGLAGAGETEVKVMVDGKGSNAVTIRLW